ncbi:DNA topoisomerase IB [Olivibacter sitiensis]|uniref:DNA topoisomerase IB n=1 Tax=Olivibacter sitiensis TaxID=376470 RepID=UPI00041E28C9|nr:DNA topoisomerase IB [Olivibacter sitiensis]
MGNELLENSLLCYYSDSKKGWKRLKKGRGYSYLDEKEAPIKDANQLQRIKALVIPPAWSRVWICPKANGHLQATGYDDRGRKQYIYHEEWNKLRGESKFQRMYSFGKQLPKLRKQIKKDLRRHKVDKHKAIAIALEIMEETLIRAGNIHYRETNGSYGLTTLYRKQLKLKKGLATFDFRGKKGVQHHIEVDNARLVKHLAKMTEIPGQELFSYYDAEGNTYAVGSGDLNSYIQDVVGDIYTTKDYRTWCGTVWAFRYLASLEAFEHKNACKRNINACLDYVAKKLGNTRAVCRSYYVHKALIDAYENGKLNSFLKAHSRERSKAPETLQAERYVLRFLKNHTFA